MPPKGLSTLSSVRELANKIGFRPRVLWPPATLAAFAAISEAASLALLLPATRASISMDFGSLRSVGFFQFLFVHFKPLEALSDASLFLLLLAAIFLAVLVKILLTYFAAAAFARQVHILSSRLRRSLFDRTLHFGKLYFDQANSGHIQHVILSSSESIATQMILAHEVLSALFMLSAYLLIMLLISWKLTLSLILVFPAVLRSGNRLVLSIKDSSKSLIKARQAMTSHVANILTGILLVKSYSSEAWEQARFETLSEAVDRRQLDIDLKSTLIKPIQEALFLLMMLALLFGLAFIAGEHRSELVPGLLVFVYLARRASISIMLLGHFKAATAAIDGSIAEALLLLKDEDKFRVTDGTIRFDGLQRGIRFRDLNYSFPNGLKIIAGVSFFAAKGEMTAIVGPSGTGKTTLINLLLRFYQPPPGAILVDDRDIRDITLASLSSRIALVNQDTLLLNDTIRNNLAYAERNALSDDALYAALEQARLLDFVRRQPHGLDTTIGDRGIKLSGGEKQRLSIARAILKGADILLLDEATSSLDSKTETLLQESFEALIKGKTSLVIAHRLSTIKNADKIVVLENGAIQEEGSLDHLLSVNGPFRGYWEAQKFR